MGFVPFQMGGCQLVTGTIKSDSIPENPSTAPKNMAIKNPNRRVQNLCTTRLFRTAGSSAITVPPASVPSPRKRPPPVWSITCRTHTTEFRTPATKTSAEMGNPEEFLLMPQTAAASAAEPVLADSIHSKARSPFQAQLMKFFIKNLLPLELLNDGEFRALLKTPIPSSGGVKNLLLSQYTLCRARIIKMIGLVPGRISLSLVPHNSSSG